MIQSAPNIECSWIQDLRIRQLEDSWPTTTSGGLAGATGEARRRIPRKNLLHPLGTQSEVSIGLDRRCRRRSERIDAAQDSPYRLAPSDKRWQSDVDFCESGTSSQP